MGLAGTTFLGEVWFLIGDRRGAILRILGGFFEDLINLQIARLFATNIGTKKKTIYIW